VIHFKGDPKSSKEPLEENMEAEKQDESKKWEQMGAKPKKRISPDAKPETKGDKTKEQSLKAEKPVNKDQNRWNSLDSADQKEDPENIPVDEKQESLEKGMKSDSEDQPKQNNSLESENHPSSYQYTTENMSKDKQDSLKAEKQNLAEPEQKLKDESEQNIKPCTDHKYGAKPSKRRGSLDSGDHESEVQGSKGMSRSVTGSDWSMDLKLKRNHSLELDGNCWGMEAGHEDILKGSSLSEKSTKEVRKGGDKDVSGNGADGEHKRDPRVERRIRNKVKEC
jgi:hypothetical protein